MSQSCANVSNEVSLDLEKKIDSICKEASSYYSSLFKKMSFKNLQNANILYEFLITEQNYQNVKLSTKITHIKAICLFNQYIHYKDFEKITKNDVMNYYAKPWIGKYRRSTTDDI